MHTLYFGIKVVKVLAAKMLLGSLSLTLEFVRCDTLGRPKILPCFLVLFGNYAKLDAASKALVTLVPHNGKCDTYSRAERKRSWNLVLYADDTKECFSFLSCVLHIFRARGC